MNFIFRLLTGIVGGFLLLFFVYLGFLPFAFFVAFISILALLEYYRMCEQIDLKCYKIVGILSSLCISLIFFLTKGDFDASFLSFGYFQILLVIVLVTVGTIAVIFVKDRDLKEIFLSLVSTIFGIFYVSFLFNHLILIREIPFYGKNYVFILFFCVWALDVFAYIFGLFFGKRKLSSRISPKKSIEGSLAGFFAAIVFCLVFNKIFNTNFGFKHSVIIGAIIGIFGQIGDLFESLIKRSANQKDSGKILPGHGGILDRFDSIIFTAPLFFYYVKFFV